ncbi:NepR family anti-sigma factor [Roseomonas haemaphysalidis]|jgi:hypothetical protein|uniref:Anti-sigma factor NepR domain-containing protein n=1 Tax=Roseomonas haemaphysalidis TaxID=2768162 RepID=A0ABS3KUZ6_9PROT|nr:NepR family anti-sigma factor [Roseomonas haemaphysalidis]MBO1080765.1 hypothetical protein [Roseomonas haemaphysalidis]
MKRYSRTAPVEQRALEQWTQRNLKDRYDEALKEPVPDELLALLRQFPSH